MHAAAAALMRLDPPVALAVLGALALFLNRAASTRMIDSAAECILRACVAAVDGSSFDSTPPPTL